MEQTVKSTPMDRSAGRNTGRSFSIFLVTTITALVAFVGRWGAAGVVLGFLIAFGITEGLARRFPEGVQLHWVFRPNLVIVGVVGGLFLLSIYLLPGGATCIEGGRVIGFPLPFLAQCNGPGGTPDRPELSLVSLAFDVIIWYVLGTLIAALVRPRKSVLSVLA